MADRFGVSLAPYIHALFGLLDQKRARRVLIIGCGGGSLATMLSRKGTKAILLDIDPRAFVIARRYFHLPASVECQIADGARFLRRNSAGRYDVIVLDPSPTAGFPSIFSPPDFSAWPRAGSAAAGWSWST